jgi:hypothetical protein
MFAPLEAAVLATFLLLVADRIPALKVESHCRAVAQKSGWPDDLVICRRQEQEAHNQLVRQWGQFAAADKSHCLRLSTLGGEPTYTELLTCLELQRDARNLRQREKTKPSTIGQGRTGGVLRDGN